ARARVLLYRRARLAKDACAAGRPAQGAGARRRCAGAHPRADRARDRIGVAARDRARHHGADHGSPAPAAREAAVKFGAVAPEGAKGAIVVHSIRSSGLVLKKGTVVGDGEIAALRAAGIPSITVARLEPGDVSEDTAAAEIAAAVAGEGVHVDRAFTGRANLFAEAAGVLVVDAEGIDRLNEVDPDITLATLAAFAPVVVGTII